MTDRATRILVVDDEATMRDVLEMRLEEMGYEVEVAESGARALETVGRFEPEIALLDLVLPDVEELELLEELLEDDPDRPVILMTAHGTVDLAVEAMKKGAHDFLTKPIDYRNLETVLAVAEREVEARRRSALVSDVLEGRESGLGELVGTSEPMREVYRQISEIGSTDAPVLILGESGTGKELVSREIVAHGDRADGPFITINAAAIPRELMESEIFGHEEGAFTGAKGTRKGCFELADGGTLFLDEIAEMPYELQPKLLRVIEDGRVRRVGGQEERRLDVRLLAATNRDPAEAIEEGSLREDLYYRLNVLTIELPPLRDRLDDLPLLTHHWLERFNRRHGTEVRGVRDEALERMRAYAWPGNVRELKNVLQRAVVLSGDEWMEVAHLPPYVREPDGSAPPSGDGIVLPEGASMAEAEEVLITRTYEESGRNKAETARRLGLDVKTVRTKLQGYGIS